MNGVRTNVDPVPRVQLFNCMYADCGATFSRQRRLKDHETTHTGARPVKCKVAGCGRSFTRTSHLKHHTLAHGGLKTFKCSVGTCTMRFLFADKLKRHLRYAHGQKDHYYKCTFKGCTKSFKKRRGLKAHLNAHGVLSFKCTKDGCLFKFATRKACKAHEKTHTGYTCPKQGCRVTEKTWSKIVKHLGSHKVVFPCVTCKKELKKRDSLRRHKRTHALQKPVLLCPHQGCQAYFSTTFNLQHHIRKQHLQLARHHCSYPNCERAFAMRESLVRHMLVHDPDVAKMKRRKRRSSKSWQKRLDGHGVNSPVEQDLRQLFALRMRLHRRPKLEANLNGLYNERKVPHRVEPETSLIELFSLKPPKVKSTATPSTAPTPPTTNGK